MAVLHPSSMLILSVGLLVSLTTSVRHEEGRNTIDENAFSTKKVKTGKGGVDVLGQEPQDGSSDPGDVGEIEYTNRKEEASNASFDNSVANDTKEPSSLSQQAIATEESHGGHDVAAGSDDLLKKIGLTDANIDALKGGKCLTDGPSAGLGCNFPGGCDCQWFKSCNKGDADSLGTRTACLLTPTTDACMTTLVGKCNIAIWVWIGAAALILILICICIFCGMKKKD